MPFSSHTHEAVDDRDADHHFDSMLGVFLPRKNIKRRYVRIVRTSNSGMIYLPSVLNLAWSEKKPGEGKSRRKNPVVLHAFHEWMCLSSLYRWHPIYINDYTRVRHLS